MARCVPRLPGNIDGKVGVLNQWMLGRLIITGKIILHQFKDCEAYNYASFGYICKKEKRMAVSYGQQLPHCPMHVSFPSANCQPYSISL